MFVKLDDAMYLNLNLVAHVEVIGGDSCRLYLGIPEQRGKFPLTEVQLDRTQSAALLRWLGSNAVKP